MTQGWFLARWNRFRARCRNWARQACWDFGCGWLIVAEMVGRGCTYFLLCSGQNGQWRIYVPVCRQDSARKNVDSKNTDHNMLLELSPLIFIAKAPGPVTGQQGNGQVLHKAMRLDVCFVHDIEAVFIAEFIPPWMMRVVWVSHCIEVSLLPGLMPSWRALYDLNGHIVLSVTDRASILGWPGDIWGVQALLDIRYGPPFLSLRMGQRIQHPHDNLASAMPKLHWINYKLLLLLLRLIPVEHQSLDIKQHILLGYGLPAQWVHLMDIGTRHGDGLPIHAELPVPNVHAS